VLGATDKVKFGDEVTVSTADELIPSEATVMVEVPTAIPVAIPVALMVAIAGLLLANVRGLPAKELPYWSLGVAVNCCVAPTCTDAACGVSVIEDKEGGAGVVEGLVEAGVGLPPQLTDKSKSKRKIRAIDARGISFHFLSMIAKPVALSPHLSPSNKVSLETTVACGWRLYASLLSCSTVGSSAIAMPASELRCVRSCPPVRRGFASRNC
jgi:hypothetical protein